MDEFETSCPMSSPDFHHSRACPVAARHRRSAEIDPHVRYCHWLVAAEPATGPAPGYFVRAIKADQEDMMMERVIDDPVVLAVLEIIKRNKNYAEMKRFDGTVGELPQKLLDVLDQPNRFFPATPAHLSNVLRRLAPAMTKIGVIVKFGPTPQGQARNDPHRRGRNPRYRSTPPDAFLGRVVTLGDAASSSAPRREAARAPCDAGDDSDARLIPLEK